MQSPADRADRPALTRIERDILSTHPDAPVVDLHLPIASRPRLPLVIDVSPYTQARTTGGTGSRWAPALAAHGLAVAVVREPGPLPLDLALHGIRSMVGLLRSGCTALGPAVDRIGLFGSGEGAYLAALAAYGTVSIRCRVQALAGVDSAWGATRAPDLTPSRRAVVSRRHPDAEVLHRVSEIALATGNDVPLLVVHRANDHSVAASQGTRLAHVVTAAGGCASVLHRGPEHDPLAAIGTVDAVAAFFTRTLAAASEPARRTRR
ncbi:hypothetical protein [Kitasatospora sp. NBC_01539]|uniref:hypothetical protein n=1 Tax=Kitasatospora sp. NBC_01539 TaxID=2903577 RepID=UPI0038601E71